MIDYKDIFDKAEKKLREQSWFSDEEFDRQYGLFKKFENKKRTDQEQYEMLTMIIFYSGFRASTVEDKQNIILGHLPDYETVFQYTEKDIQQILADPEMIRNKRKIKGCIANAHTFKDIVDKHGSFQNYLDSFNAHSSFDNLILLKKDLEYHFDYLGGTTVYHFLSDLGFNVLKPDRVLLRIFNRLGLIKSENHEKQLLETVFHGRQFAKATRQPIRYIDIIFVKYGQQGESKMFGLKNGICLEKNPACNICGLTDYCKYYKNRKTKMKLGRLNQVDLRNQWKKEDTDFTPWLAKEENIEILSETIGIGLEVLNQEERVGPFRADILCKDVDTGNFVLIENQLERTDHMHLGQLITYAAGLDAVTIIWISRRFTEEHRAALDWLNEMTVSSTNFFGLEIELYRIGDSLPAPLFKIISKPNDWKKSITRTAANSKITELQTLKIEYWQELINYLEEHRSFVKLRRPQPVSWSNISIGKSDIFIGASIATKGKIMIILYIRGNNSKEYFDKLENIAKERSFTQISDQIHWKRVENQKQQSITLTENADFSNKNDWENQYAWFKKYLESYIRFFKPIVKKL